MIECQRYSLEGPDNRKDATCCAEWDEVVAAGRWNLLLNPQNRDALHANRQRVSYKANGVAAQSAAAKLTPDPHQFNPASAAAAADLFSAVVLGSVAGCSRSAIVTGVVPLQNLRQGRYTNPAPAAQPK